MSKTQRFCSTNNHGVLGLRRYVFAMGFFRTKNLEIFLPIKNIHGILMIQDSTRREVTRWRKDHSMCHHHLNRPWWKPSPPKNTIYIYILCRVEYSLCNTKSSKHERLHSEFWKDLIAHKLSKRQTCTTEHVPLNRIVQAVKATKNE